MSAGLRVSKTYELRHDGQAISIRRPESPPKPHRLDQLMKAQLLSIVANDKAQWPKLKDFPNIDVDTYSDDLYLGNSLVVSFKVGNLTRKLGK